MAPHDGPTCPQDMEPTTNMRLVHGELTRNYIQVTLSGRIHLDYIHVRGLIYIWVASDVGNRR